MEIILKKLREETLESGSKEAFNIQTPNVWIIGNNASNVKNTFLNSILHSLE